MIYPFNAFSLVFFSLSNHSGVKAGVKLQWWKYESAEYLAAVEELRVIVADVRGKIIALDLENTLVSRWKERWLLWLSRWGRTQRLRSGDEKIPSVHGVDFLLDDQARAHQYYCRRRGRSRDAKKILPVEPFSVRNLDELRSHHLDIGLIAAAKGLAKVVREEPVSKGTEE